MTLLTSFAKNRKTVYLGCRSSSIMVQMYVNESYLHPDEKFVGVCPHCLNERLISLAYLSKQSFHCLRTKSYTFCSGDGSFFSCGRGAKKPVLQKSFSMSSGIFHHLEFRQHNKMAGDFRDPDIDDTVSTSSQEVFAPESYISIKIDEDTFPSWEKNNAKQSIKPIDDDSKKAPEAEHVKHDIQEKKNASELEHTTPVTTPKSAKRLGWHSCIGLGQLIKKKGSMRGWVCHASINEVAEVRRGSWIRRTFVKRREPKKE